MSKIIYLTLASFYLAMITLSYVAVRLDRKNLELQSQLNQIKIEKTHLKIELDDFYTIPLDKKILI